MTHEQRTKLVRNMVIFYAGALLLAAGGGMVMAAGQEVGGLLFILSPLLMVLVVRFLLRDGWQDAGCACICGRSGAGIALPYCCTLFFFRRSSPSMSCWGSPR